MNVSDVMDQLTTALGTITGLRAYAWARDSITPPAALVMLPTSYTFDETYGRGSDRASFDVVVCVGRADDRSAFKAIGAYANGSGASSIKAALDGGTYTACDSVRTTSVTFDVVRIAGTDYLAATFEVDVYGTGS